MGKPKRERLSEQLISVLLMIITKVRSSEEIEQCRVMRPLFSAASNYSLTFRR